jgi:hypothetical protein
MAQDEVQLIWYTGTGRSREGGTSLEISEFVQKEEVVNGTIL